MSEELDDIEVVKNVVSPADYWEWRTTLEELENAKLQSVNAQLEHLVLKKTEETIGLRATVKQLTLVEKKKTAYEKVKTDYNTYIAALEERLGFDVRNSAIHPVTFEVTKLEETKDDGTN